MDNTSQINYESSFVKPVIFSNGIHNLMPEDGFLNSNDSRRCMYPVIYNWLSTFRDLTETQLHVLNIARLHFFSGGGTEFNILFYNSHENYSCDVTELYSQVDALIQRKIITPIRDGLFDFCISTDELFYMAPRVRPAEKDNSKKAIDTSPCCVYILFNGHHYKVGISNSIDRRVSELQTASSLKIECVFKHETTRHNALKIEKKTHSKFYEDQTHGEWFDADLSQLKIAIASAAISLGEEL